MSLSAKVFSEGVEYLISQGDSDRGARAFLGKLRKGGKRDAELIAAIASAQRHEALDAKSYIAKAMGNSEPEKRIDRYRKIAAGEA